MWRRDRVQPELLRLGRHAVERWATVDGILSMRASQALQQAATPRPQDLVEAIEALYTTTPKGSVNMVIESAWLPIMHIDTGPTFLRAAQVEALARHRVGLHHSDAIDPVAKWELRIEHRPGSRHAMAYGLSPLLKQTLITAAQRLGLELAGMTPAFEWGRDRWRSHKVSSRSPVWWLWPEEDRTLVARVASNEVIGLNPGAPRVADVASAVQLVTAECVRLGVGVGVGIEPIRVGVWDANFEVNDVGESVTWFDVLARSSPSPRLALAARMQA